VLAGAWALVALVADTLRLVYQKPARSLALLFAMAIGDWVSCSCTHTVQKDTPVRTSVFLFLSQF